MKVYTENPISFSPSDIRAKVNSGEMGFREAFVYAAECGAVTAVQSLGVEFEGLENWEELRDSLSVDVKVLFSCDCDGDSEGKDSSSLVEPPKSKKAAKVSKK